VAASLFGLWGLVLLAFGTVAYAVAPGASIYVLLHVGLGLLLLLLYFTTSRESLTAVLGERSTRYGANAAVYSLAVLAVLVVCNWLAARHNVRWDLTAQNVFSLSSQSTNVLAKLDKPVEIHAFVEAGVDPLIEDLLGSYKYAAKDLTFHMVDPVKERELTERFKVTEVPTLHIQYGDRDATVTRDISEETLTNGLVKATQTTKKLVCFLEGHGEPDPDNNDAKGASSLQDALRNENYDTRKILLATEQTVPTECAILVIVGTEKPFFDHEVTVIRDALNAGRSALVLAPPKRGPQLGALLEPWGVDLTDTVVVDQVVRLFQGPALGLQILASTYGTHDITRDFRERTIFPMTRAVEADAAGKPGLHAVELVQSSPSSWGEADTAGVFERGEARLDEGDITGPVSIAVAVTGKHKEMGLSDDGETKLVVFGDADFASNQFLLQLFNRDLLLNAINWLGGQEEMIAIRPRTIRASSAQLSPEESQAIFYLSVLVVPELLLLLGLTVWWRRSTK
jgi:ABC-type uncharacterized transport system involved in gliding motility auxiliary subunit